MGQTKEQRIIKQLSGGVVQKKTPIATDMFIPNYSGLRKTPQRFHRINLEKVYHVYGGFTEANLTLSCASDTWTKITNATNDLWGVSEADGWTGLNDTMITENSGDYTGSLSLTISAIAGKDFHIRVFNVTQNKVMGYPLGVSTTGAANKTLFSMPLYLELDANDVLELQVNSNDGTDPKFSDAIFYISYLHE